jgi:hypothetical protein
MFEQLYKRFLIVNVRVAGILTETSIERNVLLFDCK